MAKVTEAAAIFLRLIFVVAPFAFSNVVRAIFRAKSRGLNIAVAVKNGILRSVMTNLRPHQLQSIIPPSSEAYSLWLKAQQTSTSKNTSPGAMEIDILPDGSSKIFWVGEKDPSSNVILLLHGGGYVLPLSKGHLEWAQHFRTVGKAAGLELSVALLDYSLSPQNPYPTQMQQAVNALEHLISLGYSPSKIVVGGDSAGGHLSLSLLSHLMHPCPSSDIPEIQLHQPLSGCFLVSPLLSLKLDTPSYTENYYSDVLSLAVIRDWGADLFRGSSFESEIAEEKAWGMALYAPKAWWDNLGHCVRRVYLVGGGEELFRDHIVEFGKLMANVKGIDFESHMEIKEAHDGTYMDFESGRLPSKSTERLARWVIECLKRSQGLVQEL